MISNNTKDFLSKMESYKDFRLSSCKIIFRLSDLLPDEEVLWIHYLKSKGYDVTNSNDMFIPLDSDGQEYATNELFVMRWEWKGHQLLDMSAHLNYTEGGIVSMDGVPFLYNRHSGMYIIDEDDAYSFKEWLLPLETFRRSLLYGVYGDCCVSINSELDEQATKMCKLACEKARSEYINVQVNR